MLLLDEPSAGLNREEREDLARHILRIRHELGIAMIWVEHDMQMVADLADRVCVLNYGRVLAEGPADACSRIRGGRSVRRLATFPGTSACASR